MLEFLADLRTMANVMLSRQVVMWRTSESSWMPCGYVITRVQISRRVSLPARTLWWQLKVNEEDVKGSVCYVQVLVRYTKSKNGIAKQEVLMSVVKFELLSREDIEDMPEHRKVTRAWVCQHPKLLPSPWKRGYFRSGQQQMTTAKSISK